MQVIDAVGLRLVPRAGVEPARPYGQRILRPLSVSRAWGCDSQGLTQTKHSKHLCRRTVGQFRQALPIGRTDVPNSLAFLAGCQTLEGNRLNAFQSKSGKVWQDRNS